MNRRSIQIIPYIFEKARYSMRKQSRDSHGPQRPVRASGRLLVYMNFRRSTPDAQQSTEQLASHHTGSADPKFRQKTDNRDMLQGLLGVVPRVPLVRCPVCPSLLPSPAANPYL